MRIISGKYRGRKIKYPEFKIVRPTKDRIREAVFNIIAAEVPGARVLDLFAGSGAYGLEALSRGAESACFVDNDERCIKVIKDNILSLEIPAKTRTIREDVFKAIKQLEKDKERFDLVFSDPPFKKGIAKKILITIGHCDILNRPSLVIIEHCREEALPETEGDVSILKQRGYKDILISIYIKK